MLPHHVAEPALQRVQLTARSSERLLGIARGALESRGVRTSSARTDDALGHHVAGNPTEHRRVGHAVASEPIGAVDAARILAGSPEAFDGRAARRIDHDAAHHEVRGRPHFHGPTREIATEVATAPHHSSETPLDDVGAQVRDVDPHATVRRSPSLLDLEERRAGDQITRGALHALSVVPGHEALAEPVAELTTGAAQAFFQERARHQRAGNHEAGRILHAAGHRPRGDLRAQRG